METLLRINDRFWLVFTLLMLLAVSALSLVPLAVPLPEPVSSDKLHHFAAYTAVAFPVALARPRFWFLFVISFAFWGIVIELIQPFVGRHRGVGDVAANVAGLVCAIGASGVLRSYSRTHRSA